MNYNENMLKFKDKESAELFIKNRTTNIINKKDKKDIIENIRRILGLSYYMYSIDLSPVALIAYENDNKQMEVISMLEKVPGFKIDDIDTLINDKKSSDSDKLILYSAKLSYYFLSGNYTKVEKTINEIMKDERLRYRDINLSSYIRVNMYYNDSYIDSAEDRALQNCRAYAALLYAGRNYNKDGYFKNALGPYTSALQKVADMDATERFLSDKMVRLMHEKIMHDYGEIGNGARRCKLLEFRSSSMSILDTFETRPDILREFLFMFPNDPETDGWNKIQKKTDYRIREYVKELTDNKDRLLEIFKNYLYSMYALGQKHSKLEDVLREMSNMMEILGFEDVNILEIVDDLPDKIQRFALKAMIGD